MPNRSYEAGVRFEHEVKDHYENNGYIVVRAAGSHSYFDLVCIRRQDYIEHPVLLLQLKRYSGSPPKPPQEFKDLSISSSCLKVWVAKPKGEKYNPVVHNQLV